MIEEVARYDVQKAHVDSIVLEHTRGFEKLLLDDFVDILRQDQVDLETSSEYAPPPKYIKHTVCAHGKD